MIHALTLLDPETKDVPSINGMQWQHQVMSMMSIKGKTDYKDLQKHLQLPQLMEVLVAAGLPIADLQYPEAGCQVRRMHARAVKA